MASNLYDTGREPRELIRETVVVLRELAPICADCGRQTRTCPCEHCGSREPVRRRENPTITMDATFEPVREPRQLPPAKGNRG